MGTTVMSMHKRPLSLLEREGLEAHKLPIGEPSQLSDSFRSGIEWAITQQTAHKLLCEIIQSGFFINYDKELEWKFQEGYSLESSLGISTDQLHLFLSQEQIKDLEKDS